MKLLGSSAAKIGRESCPDGYINRPFIAKGRLLRFKSVRVGRRFGSGSMTRDHSFHEIEIRIHSGQPRSRKRWQIYLPCRRTQVHTILDWRAEHCCRPYFQLLVYIPPQLLSLELVNDVTRLFGLIVVSVYLWSNVCAKGLRRKNHTFVGSRFKQNGMQCETITVHSRLLTTINDSQR